MNTQNLTPDQQKRLERFKVKGVRPAHLERIAARFESYNAAPQAVKGAPMKETRPEAIRGIDGEQDDGGKA